jgi:hypothetical protein
MKELEKQIKKLQKQITKQISDINHGGCIHFAYYFSKKLRELKIDHKVVLLDYDHIDVRYDHFGPVAHLMIYIEGVGYIDGEETFVSLRRRYSYFKHTNLSIKKLDKFRNEHQWNMSYDTDQNNKVEALIQKNITYAKKADRCRIHRIHEAWRNSLSGR